MSRVADYEQQREKVYKAASRLIAEIGLEAVTARRLAQETGYSTHIYTHYFKNKRQMLLEIWRWSTSRWSNRIEETRCNGGDLRLCLETLMPLDEERRIDWAAGLAFWCRATSDPEFAIEQDRSVGLLRDIIFNLLRIFVPGSAPDDDYAMAAQRLQALIVGIAIHGVADPSTWTSVRQQATLASELAITIAALQRNSRLS